MDQQSKPDDPGPGPPPPYDSAVTSQPQPYPQQPPVGGGYTAVAPPPPVYQTEQPMTFPQPQAVVVQTHTLVFGDAPVSIMCPSCNQQVTTVTHHEVGDMAWLLCGIIAITGCWLGCCLIPFCVDGCLDTIHSCPNCRFELGRKKML